MALVVIETSRPNLTFKLKLVLKKGGEARDAGEGPGVLTPLNHRPIKLFCSYRTCLGTYNQKH